jgi:serine/threonine protein kinase
MPSLPSIADLVLLQRIGGGAYGEVWLGRTALGTLRAVKIVRRAEFDDDRPYQREFEGIRKFEPISRSHEGFLDLLHVGRNDAEGYFYYVMELADDANAECGVRSAELKDHNSKPHGVGTPHSAFRTPHLYAPRTLAAEVKARGAQPLDECLRIAHALTSALAELHRHGLVHRDIKPSNIIFVNGVPKLADIGLVAAVNEARSFVGTEGFIPPEGPGTPQADLYSLGIVLYVISTGKSHRDFPEPPADLASRSDRERWLELQAVIHRACQADARQRYNSAEAMLRELDLVRCGKSVQRSRAWKRTGEYAKRAVLVIAPVAAVLAIAYWRSGWFAHPIGSARSGQLEFSWSTNEDANEEFRKGRDSLYAGGEPLQAIEHFQRATELDTNFADAYAYLSRAWNNTGTASNYAKVRMAAEKAVSLNTNCALGYSALATAKENELDWAGADAARMRALALGSNSEDILLTSALNLAVMGRTNEALAELEKARRVAPGSTSALRTRYYGLVYAWSGQYDRALNIFDQFPNGSYWMDDQHAQWYLAIGDYTNAIRLERQAALERGGDTNEVKKEFDALEKAFKDGGKDEYWKQKLKFETPKTGENHWMRMAAAHARLGQRDEAFTDLGHEKKEMPLNFGLGINTNPNLESLREDPRFRDLIAELRHKK